MNGQFHRNSTTSLRARMTLWFTAFFSLLVLCGILGMNSWSYYVARRETTELVTSAAHLLQTERDNDDSYRHVLSAFAEVAEDERLANVTLMVVEPDGALFAANHRPTPPWPPHKHDSDWITVAVPYGKRIAVAGAYWRGIRSALRLQSLLLLGLGIFVTSIASTLTWFLVGWTLRPIGALSQQARIAATNPFHVHLREPSHDIEVRQLVNTLNAMLERLREDTRAREQFYNAAAHELRTPLAVLSGSIEVVLTRPHRPEEYQETLRDLLYQTRRLISLTESLLLLNRLETDNAAETAEPIDIADVCERVLTNLLQQATARHLDVVLHLENVPPLNAPPSHMTMLVRNLLENAVRYTPEKGHIHITLQAVVGLPRLAIYNDCCLRDNLELDRLFLPFYRGDASRSTATGGNGLGLSICKAVAEANGWQISLAREGGGLCAAVLFGNEKQ